jgi:hypothetical protein
MNWVLVVLSFLWPVVQPAVQQSVQHVQLRVQQRMQQAQQPSNQPVYHNGQWWKFENGKWWVWVNQQQREELAWQHQRDNLNIR